MIQRTFAIVKPNAVRSALVGEILRRYETARFKIVGARLLHASSQKIAGFYAEHEGRPFFPGLVSFMSSGPILVLALEGENAIAEVRWRKPVGSMWSTGLSFSGISKPDLEKVDRYLTLQKRAQMEMRNSN